MLSRGGREGEEEVTRGKVNYDLMLENILKGGYHGVCINLGMQLLLCQSCTVLRMQQWGTEDQFASIFHAVNTTKMLICVCMMNEKYIS